MKQRARRILAILFAAAHVVANIIGSAAYALELGQYPPGRTRAASGGGSSAPSATTMPPLSRSMKSVDTIKVPSPAVTPHDWKSYQAVEARSNGDVSKALDGLHLTPAQRLSVRNYVGQYDEKYHVVAGVEANGVQTLGIRDAKTGDFVGMVTLKRDADGSITVNKSVAAAIDTKATFEIPLVGKVNQEEARQVLGGSKQYDAFRNGDAKDRDKENQAKLSVTLPALKAEAGADIAKASESTARFHPDGSGYEYGLVTKGASGKAEAQIGGTSERDREGGKASAGVAVGAGAKGPQVEGFVNYFGRPDVDAKGDFTRSVIGTSFEMHGTLAEAEFKAGCSTDEGCKTKLSAGALGLGGGGSLTFSSHMNLQVRPAEEIEAGGVASEEQHAPEPAVPTAEEKAYEDAVRVGTPAALNAFLAEYPDSPRTDEILNKADLSAAGEPLGLCEDFDNSGACGRAGY